MYITLSMRSLWMILMEFSCQVFYACEATYWNNEDMTMWPNYQFTQECFFLQMSSHHHLSWILFDIRYLLGLDRVWNINLRFEEILTIFSDLNLILSDWQKRKKLAHLQK